MTYYETPEPQRKRALINYHKPPTRSERREQTRQAVESVGAELTHRIVRRMVRIVFHDIARKQLADGTARSDWRFRGKARARVI